MFTTITHTSYTNQQNTNRKSYKFIQQTIQTKYKEHVNQTEESYTNHTHKSYTNQQPYRKLYKFIENDIQHTYTHTKQTENHTRTIQTIAHTSYTNSQKHDQNIIQTPTTNHSQINTHT